MRMPSHVTVVASAKIKSYQRFIAVKAALETCGKKTMIISERDMDTLNAFLRHSKLLFETSEPPAMLTAESLAIKSVSCAYTGPDVWQLYLDTRELLSTSSLPRGMPS